LDKSLHPIQSYVYQVLKILADRLAFLEDQVETSAIKLE
jgi:hypothetical protein